MNLGTAQSKDHLLSYHFLARKLREKGIGYFLWRAFTKIFLICATTPIAVPLALGHVRFIEEGNLLTRIGATAIELDSYVKAGRLGLRPHYFGILLVPAQRAVNQPLLDYWKPYITVVTNPFLVRLLRPLSLNPFIRYTIPKFTSGYGINESGPVYWKIQAEYDEKFGERPLLSLTETHMERGHSCLEKLGVPRDAWFVCLHVRESGYLPELSYHSYRDSNVDNYLQAAQAVVERGGWVIRMGNPSMKPLPPMEQVVDYVHTDSRSDWMDIFCFARCRFFLGNDSGPGAVSSLFKVPCVLADFAPMGRGPIPGEDIWIPKLNHSIKEDRDLSFQEVLESPIRSVWDSEEFDEWGISLVDSTSEDIRDLALEMMDRLDGVIQYSEEDKELQKRFKTFLEAEPAFSTGASVGRDFLRKYSYLLGC